MKQEQFPFINAAPAQDPRHKTLQQWASRYRHEMLKNDHANDRKTTANE